MTKIFSGLVGLTAMVLTQTVSAERVAIIAQPTAPILITNYTARYSPSTSRGDGITHSVTIKNTSTKKVVGYQIGLATFDAFNGFLGKFNGWAIQDVLSGSQDEGLWENRPYAAFSFEKYGTGVAYVNAVRFEDDTIWRADLVPILLELRKYEKDLKPEDLKDKKE